jgi:hypothetical protein
MKLCNYKASDSFKEIRGSFLRDANYAEAGWQHEFRLEHLKAVPLKSVLEWPQESRCEDR